MTTSMRFGMRWSGGFRVRREFGMEVAQHYFGQARLALSRVETLFAGVWLPSRVKLIRTHDTPEYR
jgi:hypothetical protein